jgi:hypothetical protein
MSEETGSHSQTAANLNEAISSDEALIGYHIDDSIDVDASMMQKDTLPQRTATQATRPETTLK